MNVAALQPEQPACDPAASPPAIPAVVLPDQEVFAPPIAGTNEPRISLGLVRTYPLGTSVISEGDQRAFTAGVVSAGAVFGLWARRHRCDDTQLGLIGGVFSQFNLDAPSHALINSDFVIGFQLTHRRGPLAARVRFYHQSSHLGDEFLLRHPMLQRLNFGFQALDGLIALDRNVWRIYGGGGARFFSQAPLPPGLLTGGVEVGMSNRGGGRPHLIGAVDLTAYQAVDWRPALSGAGGLEWRGSSSRRRLRLLLVLFDGPAPYGQFFDQQQLRHAGLQVQFEH